MNTKVVQYIISDDLRGSGKDEDPYRRVTQLFTMRGQLVAEFDPYKHTSFFNGAEGEPLPLP